MTIENQSATNTAVELTEDPRRNLNTVVDDPIPPATAADAKKAEPAAAEDSAESQDDPSKTETTEQQEIKKQSKFQRRLERQKTARIAAETEARLLREQLAKLEGQKNPREQQETGEPKREQYEDYEAYLRAVARYDAAQEAEKRLKADREERQRSERSQQDRAGYEKVAKSWNEREQKFQAEAKDYEDVVMPFVEEDLGHFSEQARLAIVESDKGPQLLYHLAQHPDVAESIATLSPLRQIAELGKLELKLAAPAKKQSSAPDPIKPIGSGRSAAQGYSDNMTDEEYRAWRKSQGATWAR